MEWGGNQNPVTEIVKRSNTKNSEAMVMARNKVKQDHFTQKGQHDPDPEGLTV